MYEDLYNFIWLVMAVVVGMAVYNGVAGLFKK